MRWSFPGAKLRYFVSFVLSAATTPGRTTLDSCTPQAYRHRMLSRQSVALVLGLAGCLLPYGSVMAQCPTGSLANFRFTSVPGQTVFLAWDAPAGATAGTSYEVLQQTDSSYCRWISNTLPTYGVIGTTTSTSYIVQLTSQNTVYIFFVRVAGCSSISTGYTFAADTLPGRPSNPTLISASSGGPGQATLNYSVPDDLAPGIAFYRAGADGVFSFIGSKFIPCPPGTDSFTDYGPGGSPGSGGKLSAGTYRYAVATFRYAGYPTGGISSPLSNSATVAVGGTCQPPSAPKLNSVGTASITSGQAVLVSWQSSAGLTLGGSYVVETSKDSSFASIDTSVTTTLTSSLVPTLVSASDYTLFIRVRAVQDCGAVTASAPISLTARAMSASFLLTNSGPSWIVKTGDAPPSAVVSFRNTGAVSGRLSFQVTGGFFDIASSSLDVPAGATGAVTLRARAAALVSPGAFAGTLIGTYSARSGTEQIATPVTLTVIPASAAGDRTGTKAHASAATIVFSAPAGQNPSSKTIAINLDPIAGQGPVFLSASVNPGGSWLVLPPTLSSPITDSSPVTFTLSVDRSKRSAKDGIPPLRALLQITPVGASTSDAVIIEVIDVETTAVQTSGGSGRAAAPPPGGTSFIVPTSVNATGAGGAVFSSDGWLKNETSVDVNADLIYTPQDKDGLADAGVLKATVTIPSGNTLRLSNLVTSIFQTTGTGQVEVRAPTPQALSLRTVVESVTGGEPATRYGTEIPTTSFGAGIGAGQGELVVPGIDDDPASRANLILTETTGASAQVNITINDSIGQQIAATATPITVPPYGKVQINRLVDFLKKGLTLSGGWAGVSVVSGSGKVVPVATVIDNASTSFSAILGRAPRANVPGNAPALTGAAPDILAALPSTLILPSAARLPGAFNTQFRTNLAIVNATASSANLTLTYNYIDADDGNQAKSVQKPLTIRGRGALTKEIGSDVILNLFGISNRSYGWIRMDGDVSRVVAVSAVAAQVDPNDTSKGFKSAQVNGIFSDSPDVMGPGDTEHRFAGTEKSVQRRTNLILVETAGQPCSVMLRAYGATGDKLAESTVAIGPNEYKQINDILGTGASALGLGDGPYQNVGVSAQVMTSGSCRVVALATVNDNISKNPEIFILKAPGPALDPTIGF